MSLNKTIPSLLNLNNKICFMGGGGGGEWRGVNLRRMKLVVVAVL